jgi:hypothetical protein
MPRRLTEVEEFYVQTNADKMTPEEISKNIPGWGAKSIENYLKNVDIPLQEDIITTGEQVRIELTEAEQYYILEKYASGVGLDAILKVMPQIEPSIIKAFIASSFSSMNDTLLKKETEENRDKDSGVVMMTKAASQHTELMKEAFHDQPRDQSDKIHVMNPNKK